MKPDWFDKRSLVLLVVLTVVRATRAPLSGGIWSTGRSEVAVSRGRAYS